jgi:hypothetical protein
MISEHFMSSARPRVLILGTRGVPAAHGGFETFAEKLALFLAQRGWQVTVYCQEDVQKVNERIAIDTWRGIERVKVQVARIGAAGTIAFDWHCVRHAAAQDAVCLVLGYNTAALLPVADQEEKDAHQHGRHRMAAAEVELAGAMLVLFQ